MPTSGEYSLDYVGGSALRYADWSDSDVDAACTRWASQKMTIRWVRGNRMHTVDGLFEEFAAALQFPWYFGWNWGAFDECLSDLGWIDFSSFVIILRNAEQVLLDDCLDLPAFLRGVLDAYEVFAHPIDKGEWWDRPAKPFHFVLQISKEASHRWDLALDKVRTDFRGLSLSKEGQSVVWLDGCKREGETS